MQWAFEMASSGMIYMAGFITIVSGILAILRLIPQQFDRLYCWY
jgi:hypothetical protein